MSLRSIAVIAMMMALLFLGCSDDDSATDSPAELRVVSVEPVDGALQVPVDQSITVNLSEAVDASSLDDSCFIVSPDVDGVLSDSGRILTFTPDTTLDSNTVYEITLTTHLTCTGGDNLDSNYTWSFKTVDGAGYYWHESPTILANGMQDVIYAQGKFVMVGETGGEYSDARVYTSTDGIDWVEQEIPQTGTLEGLTYFQGMFIGVGPGGRIYSSATGETWTKVDAGIGWVLFDIASNDTLAVATSYGRVYTTTDGLDWTTVMLPLEESIRAICWTGSMFVAVVDIVEDSVSHIFTSSDGITWQHVTIEDDAVDHGLYGVCSSDDLIVAVGALGRVFTSSDGVSWEKHYYEGVGTMFERASLHDVLWDGQRFIVVGESYWGLGGVAAISTDGANWDQHSSVAKWFGSFRAIAWSGDRLVVATLGMDGRVFYSPE